MVLVLNRSAIVAVIAASGISLAAAPVSMAGNGNVLYLVQESSGLVPDGASFSSDQSTSNFSSIGTPLTPAVQRGPNDVARITIDSQCALVSTSCGHVELTQDNDYVAAVGERLEGKWYAPIVTGALNAAANSFGGNAATIGVGGDAAASISQYGYGNQAEIVANDASGAINQIGLGNSASLNVSPLTPSALIATVTLNQIGINNTIGLDITAAPGTVSSYTQIGANASYGSSAAPVAISTTRSVNVTKISF
ncbi:hypothetical protein PSQ19_10990 [Devosia algicola]|uniref:Uncharacterized protein n=1 Tax=Devosia algicola TaxID=3026418 RepID=A0ABY7YJI4_9HYPH|nr:hypothetical protein [Devosia algicola]WDR01352.1 hypothetical protein PSQ19_10990 [Devosia algicola]